MKNNPYNMSSTNSKYLILFISIFMGIWYLLIIKYLKELEICNCTQEVKDNIQMLLYLEYLLILLVIIDIITIIYMVNYQKGGGKYDIYMILLFIIYAFIVYNGIKIFNKINNKCECSMSTLRYLLYGQIILIIITIFNMILNYNNMKNSVKSIYR